MGFLFGFLCALFFTVNNITLKKGMRLANKDNGLFMTIMINVTVLGLALMVYRLVASSIFLKTEEKLTPLVIVSGLVVFFGAGVIALTG